MDISSLLAHAPVILSECAVAERLRRDKNLELHPLLFNSPLLYDSDGMEAMKSVYKEYRDTALDTALPLLLCAPTWRLDERRLAEAGFDENLITDAVAFMRSLEEQWQHPDSPLIIGALIGPKNDCYRPDLAPTEQAARNFHRRQIEVLALSGPDCIVAQTMPSVAEALGMSHRLAETTIPYIISFVIDRQGNVLDSTPLPEAISTIDNQTGSPPLGYMVNCVYPTFLDRWEAEGVVSQRLIGIQANSSSKDHTELDEAEVLHRDDLSHWGRHMLHLNRKLGVTILGGCCGTDNSYLRYLVDHLPSGS